MPCEESKAIMQMPGGGRALRIEKRARHVAHKYLRMLLIIAQWRTCCSRRRREGNRELELGRQAAGTGELGTLIKGTWVFCLILNLAKFISHSLHAQVFPHTRPFPCISRPASGRIYELWRGTFEPCWCKHVACCLCGANWKSVLISAYAPEQDRK